LKEGFERYIGNSWIENNDTHETIYHMWSSFRDEAITGIGGMTMNERLYYFGLFERFDDCEDQHARLVLYKKLHANP